MRDRQELRSRLRRGDRLPRHVSRERLHRQAVRRRLHRNVRARGAGIAQRHDGELSLAFADECQALQRSLEFFDGDIDVLDDAAVEHRRRHAASALAFGLAQLPQELAARPKMNRPTCGSNKVPL